MRSMASESAKELVRRSRRGEQVSWVDWYAVDFAEEPSALEPRVLVRELEIKYENCGLKCYCGRLNITAGKAKQLRDRMYEVSCGGISG